MAAPFLAFGLFGGAPTARASCGGGHADGSEASGLIIPRGPVPPGDALYGLHDCPYCQRAKGWFAARGVALEFRDLDDEAAGHEAAVQQFTGQDGVPVVVIGGKVVVGFEPVEYDKLLRSR